jgi:hypothetical protein
LPGNICTAESEKFVIEKTHTLAIAMNGAYDLKRPIKLMPRRTKGEMLAHRIRTILATKRQEADDQLLMMGGGGE